MRDVGTVLSLVHDQLAFDFDSPEHRLLDRDTVAWLARLPMEDVEPPQRLALAMARRGEHLDNATYRRATGVTDARLAGRHLTQLVDAGLLEIHGARRWAYYGLGPVASARTLEVVAALVPQALSTIERRHRQIMAVLAGRPPASRQDVAGHLGLSLKQTRNYLQQLIDEGRVRATRPPRDPHQRFEIISE